MKKECGNSLCDLGDGLLGTIILTIIKLDIAFFRKSEEIVKIKKCRILPPPSTRTVMPQDMRKATTPIFNTEATLSSVVITCTPTMLNIPRITERKFIIT